MGAAQFQLSMGVASTACAAARFAASRSPAPSAFAMKARKPTASAEVVEFRSQLMVVVEPTAAVACVPSAPTIAVSMYCTAVFISCSSMVGHARPRITPIRLRSRLCICLCCMESLLCA